jgi:predicted nucleic-acid-binding Zn-ribbon protein
MKKCCPECGKSSVIAQDIEALSDSALLVKLSERIQLTCQQCGWIEFEDLDINVHPEGHQNPALLRHSA